MRKSDSSWIDVHAPDAWNDEEETFFDCPVFLVGDCNCGYRSYVSKIDDLSRSHFISESLHVSRQNHLLERTGDWLIDSCKFREWLDPKGSPLLWLHGKAGKGKSMLTSAILDSLKTSIRYGDVLTFFFYDGRFKGFNLARNILGEMLVGLLSQLQPGESRESLDSLSADLCTVGDKLSVSQMKFFFSAIRHSLKSHQTLWIVLDGLDEVEDSRRGPNEVLGALLRLATTYDPEHRIKCFISSRPAYLSGRMLWDCIQVDLDLEVSARNDLKRYVNETVQMLPLSKRSVQPPDFVEELVTRANGVFLWVALVVRSLLAEADNWNNTQRHSEMSDLSGIYRHMFNLIPKENCSTALIMLGHVVAAARPLSITELGGFMELDSDLTASDIARLSGGLLTMQKGQRVSLVHFSAREFIPLFPGANESIARTCVKALHPHDLAQTFGLSVEETAVRGADQASKIRSYVCHYWKFHYLLAEPQSNSLPGLLHSYLKGGVKNKLINSSVTNTAPESHFLALNQPEFRHTANMVLRAACHNGFPKLAKLGLQLGATEHVSTSYTESLLHLAVKVGDIGVIASLINYGADVNQRDQAGLTPLYFAAISANREIVELLCRHESVSFDSTLSMGSQTSEHSPDRADGILDKGGQPHHLLTILKLSVTMLNRCSHCLGIRPEYTVSDSKPQSTGFIDAHTLRAPDNI